MEIINGECWGLVPARGGSKSIPLKNMAHFGRRPLIDYVICAAQASATISRLICSTDSERISAHCRANAVQVLHRPAELADDAAPVQDVIRHTLDCMNRAEGKIAEFCALLQPTSPFLLAEHIDDCVYELQKQPNAGSAQTVIPCPHNHHAINQRVIRNDFVEFKFEEERRIAYNKQRKAPHYLFGNLIVFRSTACLEQEMPFANPSLPVIIDDIFGFDADGPKDFKLGELLLQNGWISLPHMERKLTETGK